MEDSQEWGQGRIVMAMVGGSLAVLLLLGGLCYWIYLALVGNGGTSPDPAAAGPDSSHTADVPRADKASEEMSYAEPEDAKGGRPALQKPEAINVPVPTLAGAAGVATGYPHTPAGAVGQLAAIDRAAYESMDLDRAQAIWDGWATPEAKKSISFEEWEVTEGVAGFLEHEGGGRKKRPSTVVTVHPSAAQIKATDGKDWVVACVLHKVDASAEENATIAAGRCQAMQWDTGRQQWLIGPEKPARAPSTWPGSEKARQAGWKEWVNGE